MKDDGFIKTNALGLEDCRVFIAHEKGDWGPENNGDYKKHEMFLETVHTMYAHEPEYFIFKIDCSFLENKEEFKLVIPNLPIEKAYAIYAERLANEFHVGKRFDYDLNTKSLWLLADVWDVIRLGQWNQNNVYRAL